MLRRIWSFITKKRNAIRDLIRQHELAEVTRWRTREAAVKLHHHLHHPWYRCKMEQGWNWFGGLWLFVPYRLRLRVYRYLARDKARERKIWRMAVRKARRLQNCTVREFIIDALVHIRLDLDRKADRWIKESKEKNDQEKRKKLRRLKMIQRGGRARGLHNRSLAVAILGRAPNTSAPVVEVTPLQDEEQSEEEDSLAWLESDARHCRLLDLERADKWRERLEPRFQLGRQMRALFATS